VVQQVRKSKEAVSLDEVADSNAAKKSKEKKRNESLTSEMMYGKSAYKRTATATMQERDMGYARLHDFYNNKSVEMFWDVTPEATANQVFKLKVGKEEVFLSAVELQKYLRWV